MHFTRLTKTSMAVVALCGWLPATSHALYIKKNLRATDAAYCAEQVDAEIKNAWGIAIRPAGLGGHFWVTGNGTGKSVQYVGDVAGKAPPRLKASLPAWCSMAPAILW
jgi:hypothetical protein